MTTFLFLTFSASLAYSAQQKYRSPCKIHHPSDSRVEFECKRLRAGENIEKLFGDRWQDVLRFNRVDRRHVYQGIFLKIPKNLKDVEGFTSMPLDYPPAKTEAKFILVDLSEQFLGAYEFGRLVFSAPIASGEKPSPTPAGEFKITAADRNHSSSLYLVEGTPTPYPMHFALLFYVDKNGVSFWLHGRDFPGYPASHGCIGLYDEEMQEKFYGFPPDPTLDSAKQLYEWVLFPRHDTGKTIRFEDGPGVWIVGRAP